MPSPRAEELFNQALDLLDIADQTKDLKGMKDALSLLILAIKTAGEPYPDAEVLLAITAAQLQDAKTALTYADLTLKHDVPITWLSFDAQLVRVDIAMAKVKVVKGGLLGWAQVADQGGYLGWAMTLFQTTDSQGQFRIELEKIVNIFTQLCSQPQYAEEFLRQADTLIQIGDTIRDNNVPMRGKKVQLYTIVAEAKVDKVIYKNEDERKKINITQSIAMGRGML